MSMFTKAANTCRYDMLKKRHVLPMFEAETLHSGTSEGWTLITNIPIQKLLTGRGRLNISVFSDSCITQCIYFADTTVLTAVCATKQHQGFPSDDSKLKHGPTVPRRPNSHYYKCTGTTHQPTAIYLQERLSCQ